MLSSFLGQRGCGGRAGLKVLEDGGRMIRGGWPGFEGEGSLEGDAGRDSGLENREGLPVMPLCGPGEARADGTRCS